MSLVYEALQKAEREKQRKTGASSVPPSPIAPTLKPVTIEKTAVAVPIPATAKSTQGALFVVAASVALVAIVAIALMVVHQKPTKPEEGVPPVVSKVSQPQTVAPVRTTVAPVPQENEFPLKLTGIAPLPDGGFCAFFAGQPLPVYEQQSIEGATVKKIGKDRVTLEFNGHPVILRLF